MTSLICCHYPNNETYMLIDAITQASKKQKLKPMDIRYQQVTIFSYQDQPIDKNIYPVQKECVQNTYEEHCPTRRISKQY